MLGPWARNYNAMKTLKTDLKVKKQQRPKNFALLVSRQHRCVQRSTGKLSALFFTRTVNRQSDSVTADISNLSLVSNLLFLQTMTDILFDIIVYTESSSFVCKLVEQVFQHPKRFWIIGEFVPKQVLWPLQSSFPLFYVVIEI